MLFFSIINRHLMLWQEIILRFFILGYEQILAQLNNNNEIETLEVRGFYGKHLKRVFDVLAIICLLIVALPIMTLIAIALKIESPFSPILYTQLRHGKGQAMFKIYKFRSMRHDSLGQKFGGKQARISDNRVTRIGKILRRSSLDELPQFFNVLRGDMSLIGPRPHAVDHNYFYEQHISNYWRRHLVRPGITGLAQVMGHRGRTKRIADMTRRVEYDIQYVRELGLWLDIKIFFLTFRELLFPRNAH